MWHMRWPTSHIFYFFSSVLHLFVVGMHSKRHFSCLFFSVLKISCQLIRNVFDAFSSLRFYLYNGNQWLYVSNKCLFIHNIQMKNRFASNCFHKIRNCRLPPFDRISFEPWLWLSSIDSLFYLASCIYFHWTKNL